MTAIRLFLAGLPKWVYYAAAGVALVVAALWYVESERSEAVKADRDAANVETVTKAREADGRAQGAAMDVSDDVEAGNRAAEGAARGSDDPLKDGLDAFK